VFDDEGNEDEIDVLAEGDINKEVVVEGDKAG